MAPDDASPKRVLDASALLAWLQSEPGAERVDPSGAAMSSVNWSEVVQKSAQRGVDTARPRTDLEALGLAIALFSATDAEAAAALYPSTRAHGLSLADRACLALARKLGVPAVTADRAWSDLDVSGLLIETIRS